MGKNKKKYFKMIIENIDMLIADSDIKFFCDNQQVIDEFMEKYSSGESSQMELKNFLLKNQEYLDEEYLVLLLIKNYQDSLEMVKDQLEEHKEKESLNSKNEITTNSEFKEKFNYVSILYNQVPIIKNNLSKILKIAKEMDIKKCLPMCFYIEDKQIFKLEVLDPRELIDGIKLNTEKNKSAFDNIDLYFKDGDKKRKYGIEYVIQAILEDDLCMIFADPYIGKAAESMILENAKLKKRKIEEAGKGDLNPEDILSDIKEILREFSQYVNLDKLLLTSALRLNEAIEKGTITFEEDSSLQFLLKGILKNIKRTNTRIICNPQNEEGELDKSRTIEYSVEDLKRCISKFTKIGYLTDNKIEDYRKRITSGEISLDQIPSEYIDIVFSKEKLEKASKLSEDNLIYVAKKQKWDDKKVLEAIKNRGKCSNQLLKDLVSNESITIEQLLDLYGKEIFSIDNIKGIKEAINLSDRISFNELNNYYQETRRDPENEELEKQYRRYLDLYKEIIINDKSEEELKEISDNILLEELIKYYDEEDKEKYIEYVENYYKEGLLTLKSLVTWSGKDIITRLYNDQIIDLEDIQSIGLELGYEYLNNLYTQLVYNEEITYNQRIEYIESGFVEEKDVINLYKKGLITDEDFMKLANKSLVQIDIAEQLIENRDLQERIKNARAKPLGWSIADKVFDVSDIAKKYNGKRRRINRFRK